MLAGTTSAKGGYNKSKEIQNLNGKSNAVAAERKAFQARQVGEGYIRARPNSFEISPLFGDTPNSLSSKRERNASVHQNGRSGTSVQILRSLRFTVAASNKGQDQELSKTGKRKEPDSRVPHSRMSPRLDVATATDGALPVPLAHVLGLDECSDEESDMSTRLISDLFPSHDDARRADNQMEKHRPKKARKMRTLDDIMKSKETLSDENKCISSENALPNDSGNVEVPSESEQADEHPDHVYHLIQDAELLAVKRKNKRENTPKDGEGTCLVQWLKKLPKKGSLHDGELRHVKTPKLANVEALNFNIQFSGRVRKNQERIKVQKQNMMPEVEVLTSSLIPQEDCTTPVNNIITNNVITDDLGTKNLHSRSAGTILSWKGAHHKRKTPNNSRHETPRSKKKNKRPLPEDATSDQQFFQVCDFF